jgi:glycosyltransferase involved in cell wall biosynthesis
MKVSIVLPVYNGEETLRECLEAILNIDYPKDDYELVVVNDGSKDKSDEIIRDFIDNNKNELRVKYVNLQENVGRIKARLRGVEESNYENLLFIDHRCIVYKNIVKEIEKKKYQPLIGNPYQDKKESIISNFFYVLRRIIYYPNWGENFEDVFINEENFDKIAKGFCPFFCDKELFFRSLPEERGRNVNDDTLIFSNIIKEKEILKTSDCKVKYYERDLREGFFWHLINRGPKFVHFYFHKNLKYKIIILLIALGPFIFTLLLGWLVLLPKFLYVLSGILIIAPILIMYRYKFSIRDIFLFFFLLPFFIIVFSLGIWKGLFFKIFKSFD